MILVRLMGGLGNQMFQYAAGRSLSLHHGVELKLDTTLLEMGKKLSHEVYTHRDLDLGIFKMPLQYASTEEIEYFNGRSYSHLAGKVLNRLVMMTRRDKLVLEQKKAYDARVKLVGPSACLVGSWQSEKYFKEVESQIHNDFQFRDSVTSTSLALLDLIKAHTSICVNVRRGDYVTSPLYSKEIGALPVAYYNDAIRYLEHKIEGKIFVFSDDIEWCKMNLRSQSELIFVGHEHAGTKFANYLQLMTFCKHFIIPNSTFGWWAAWLGEHHDKQVIAPKRWVLNPAIDPVDIIPEGWKRI